MLECFFGVFCGIAACKEIIIIKLQMGIGVWSTLGIEMLVMTTAFVGIVMVIYALLAITTNILLFCTQLVVKLFLGVEIVVCLCKP